MVVNGNAIDNSLSVPQMDLKEISVLADQFVLEYYTVMNKCPDLLHRFYKEDSSLIYDNDPIFGQENIHNAFMNLKLNDTHVLIHKVDALRANNNSVLIQVCGEISISSSLPRRFMRSFTLCEKSRLDFYVLSDILRFQDSVFIPEVKIPIIAKEISPKQNAVSPSNEISQKIEVVQNQAPLTLKTETPVVKKEPKKNKKGKQRSETIIPGLEVPKQEYNQRKVDIQETITDKIIDNPTASPPISSAKKTWADLASAVQTDKQGIRSISATYHAEQAPIVFNQLCRETVTPRNQDIRIRPNDLSRTRPTEFPRNLSGEKHEVRPRGSAVNVRGPQRGSQVGGRVFEDRVGADQRQK